MEGSSAESLALMKYYKLQQATNYMQHLLLLPDHSLRGYMSLFNYLN